MAEPVPSVRWTCRSRSPSRLGHLDHVGARDRGVGEVDGGVGVVLLGRVPAGEVHPHPALGPAAAGDRQGYMFSTANAMPVDSSSAAMPSTKPAAYSFCQRNGGCTTTTSAPTASAISADRCELAPRVGAPDPLGEQQARRVHGADRHLVVLGQLLDRGGLLAERVDADHHLDGVVARAATA